MRVKVTGYIDPAPDEIDTADDSGLTSEAYDDYMTMQIMSLDDFHFTAVEDDDEGDEPPVTRRKKGE